MRALMRVRACVRDRERDRDRDRDRERQRGTERMCVRAQPGINAELHMRLKFFDYEKNYIEIHLDRRGS